MPLIDKAVIQWVGVEGQPAYSVFYANHGPNGVLGKIHDFFNTIKPHLPNTVLLVFPTTGIVIDSSTGFLDSEWGPVTGLGDVAGTGTSGYASASGVSIRWATSGLAQPSTPTGGVHKVHGRTYLVPIDNSATSLEGTLGQTAHSLLQNAADNFVSACAGNLVIWAPVVRDKAGVVFRQGSVHPVTGARVNTDLAVLRSRRD